MEKITYFYDYVFFVGKAILSLFLVKANQKTPYSKFVC